MTPIFLHLQRREYNKNKLDYRIYLILCWKYSNSFIKFLPYNIVAIEICKYLEKPIIWMHVHDYMNIFNFGCIRNDDFKNSDNINFDFLENKNHHYSFIKLLENDKEYFNKYFNESKSQKIIYPNCEDYLKSDEKIIIDLGNIQYIISKNKEIIICEMIGSSNLSYHPIMVLKRNKDEIIEHLDDNNIFYEMIKYKLMIKYNIENNNILKINIKKKIKLKNAKIVNFEDLLELNWDSKLFGEKVNHFFKKYEKHKNLKKYRIIVSNLDQYS